MELICLGMYPRKGKSFFMGLVELAAHLAVIKNKRGVKIFRTGGSYLLFPSTMWGMHSLH